ncbi:hypothetical protein LG634_14510 [Streptomyces bambusae]|uniref:hypothetical protein n=1 Tax=Streptomyces bambusae TaxID=1550616 RepID=UPI001CFDD58D|nr:hypothetical protein [Streptomyces bambusae]MCB5166044.1 hypothetical protein [Streptomyces bambusae]
MPDTPDTKAPYPGRPELDAANARFRRAVTRLQKEAFRHDPDLVPSLTAIVSEAAEHLLRLAGDAEAAEASSARNRKQLAEAAAKMRRTLAPAARRGDPRALRMLAQLDRQKSPQ